jgi:hypothetical protein
MNAVNSQNDLESKEYKARQAMIRQRIEAHLRNVAERFKQSNAKPHKPELAFLWQTLIIMDELDRSGVDDDDSRFHALYQLQIAYEMVNGKPMKTKAEVEAETENGSNRTTAVPLL